MTPTEKEIKRLEKLLKKQPVTLSDFSAALKGIYSNDAIGSTLLGRGYADYDEDGGN